MSAGSPLRKALCCRRGLAFFASLSVSTSVAAPSLVEHLLQVLHRGRRAMSQQSLRSLIAALLLLFGTLITPSRAEDQAASRPIQEEIWALPLPLPMFAYVVRPVGDGPFPLAIMNHGVSMTRPAAAFSRLWNFATPPNGLPNAAISWWPRSAPDTAQPPSTYPSMGSTARSSRKSESAATPTSTLRALRSLKSTSGSSTIWPPRNASCQRTSSSSGSPPADGPRSRFQA